MHHLKALVVDDSKVGRLTMQKKLEALGVGVALAESGLEALSYLERLHPDVIFMDHMMPDLDGFEATRRIKANPATRDIPVVIVSGADDEGFIRQARAVGATDAILKPPTSEAIEKVLATLSKVSASPVAEAVPAGTEVAWQGDQTTLQHQIEAVVQQLEPKLREAWLTELPAHLEASLQHERQLMRDWINGVQQRLDAYTALIERLQQRLRDSEAKLAELASEQAPAQPSPAAAMASVEARIAAKLGELDAHAATLSTQLNEWRQELLTRLAAQQAQIERVADDLTRQIAASTQALQQRQDALETTAANSATAQAALEAALADKVSALIDEVERQRPSPLLAEMAQLRQQVHALQQELGALQSQLATRSEELNARVEERLAWLRSHVESVLTAAEGQQTQTRPIEPTAGLTALTQPEPVQPSDHAAGTSNSSWQAELRRVQRRLKTLSVLTAVGGIALWVALIVLTA